MRVDVITASRHGSTAEIGEAVARRLRDRGHDARALEADEVEQVDPGVAIVLGSPIYMGKWMKPARRLAEQLGAEPPGRPLWMFSIGPLGDPPEPADAKPDEPVARVAAERATEHRVLTGRLNRAELGFRERMAIRAVKAPEGDFRDFDAVEAWADEIAAALDAR